MRRRVHQPGRVQAQGHPQEDTPQDHRPSAPGQQAQPDGRQWHPVVFRKPDMELVAAQVRRVPAQHLGLRVQRFAAHDPAHVRPKGSIVGCVRVALVVGKLVVDPVRGHPKNRTALERERAAHRHRVLDQLGYLIAAMGQKPVVAHADADVDRQHVQDDGRDRALPGEEEQRGDGQEVKNRHYDGGDPGDGSALGRPAQLARRWGRHAGSGVYGWDFCFTYGGNGVYRHRVEGSSISLSRA